MQASRIRALSATSFAEMSSAVEHLEENVAAAELKIDANKMQELGRLARAGQEPAATPCMICSRIHRLHLLDMAFIQSRVHLGYSRRPAEARS